MKETIRQLFYGNIFQAKDVETKMQKLKNLPLCLEGKVSTQLTDEV